VVDHAEGVLRALCAREGGRRGLGLDEGKEAEGAVEEAALGTSGQDEAPGRTRTGADKGKALLAKIFRQREGGEGRINVS
jgi:hypothetical protein